MTHNLNKAILACNLWSKVAISVKRYSINVAQGRCNSFCLPVISRSSVFYTRSFVMKVANFSKKVPKEKECYQLENLTSSQDSQDDKDYEELVHRVNLQPGGGHQVLIIQPYVKWGPQKKDLTTPELMLEEAKALIHSLPNWLCVDTVKTPLLTLEKKEIFGSGMLESLGQKINRNKNISAIFVSVDILRGIQRKELENAFGIPIYDRYSIVLQIFRQRAQTQEAKLQVAVAEIPYLRSRLVSMQKGSKGGLGNQSRGTAAIGGSGESFYEMELRLLERKEHKFKKELEKLSQKRSLLKSERKRKEFPVVAVVGYTNSGKTTLIKALTGDSKLEPKDALFATLDVTVHACKLPCNLTVLLVDTVGFISNIPTNLIAAFNSTLRDALDADVLLHVQDVSHPDLEQQSHTVQTTLQMLQIDSSKPILMVSNKIDKASVKSYFPDELQTSAINGTGLNQLTEKIESTVIEVTKRKRILLRVRNGGAEYSWLHKETTVSQYYCTKDPEYLVLDVIVTPSSFGKLKSCFPHIQMLVNR